MSERNNTKNNIGRANFVDANKTCISPSIEASKQPTTQTGRKRLNDLDGKEWIRTTKSVWLNPEHYKDIKTVECAMES